MPGMQDQPERRYTRGGGRAHLLAFGTDLNNFPYTPAYCGMEPTWPDKWLGSGTQDEYDRAAELPVCKNCMRIANHTAEFIVGLVGA